MSLLTKLFKSENEKLINKFYPLVDKVLALEDDLKLLSDIKLKEKSLSLKNKIQDEIKIEEDILKLKNLN